MLVILLLLITVLIILSGVLSGTETSLISLSKTDIKRLSLSQEKYVKKILSWLEFPEYLITTILIGNTTVNYLLTISILIFAINLFTDIPKNKVEFYSWLVTILVILIFGEIGPKIFARRFPLTFSKIVFKNLNFVLVFFSFLSKGVTTLIRKFFPKLKSPPLDKIFVFELEELKNILKESYKYGEISEEESDMLQKILTLGNIRFKDIMTTKEKVNCLFLSQFEKDYPKTLDLVAEMGSSRIIVFTSENLWIGYIHTRDMLTRWIENKRIEIEEIIRPVFKVKPNDYASEYLDKFRNKNPIAVVVDENNIFKGIVTLEDILEEIVGEILDEYDIEKKKMAGYGI